MNKKKKHQKVNKKGHKKRKNKKKTKNINLLYVNPDGITGKITSLISTAQATNAHIIGLAETKLGKTHPIVQGYEWINKPRKGRTGGGVAMLIREDIYHLTEPVEDLEDQNQEILWVKIEAKRAKTYIGIYYGPQEKCSKEEAERQYAQITSQINKLKTKGQVILMGDFNAKLEIKTQNITQNQTRNGKYLQKMLDDTDTKPVTLQADIVAWTRTRKRKDIMEKSIIDYVIMSNPIADLTKMVHIDEAGIYKLKGKEETDHNTITIEVELPTAEKITREKIMNLKDEEGWKQFNQILEDTFKDKSPENYDEYEKVIKETIKKSFKTITITKGIYKYKKSDECKRLKKVRKQTKKEFENAPKEQKKEKLQAYIEAQKSMRNELENMERDRVEQRINLIIKAGGAGSDHFWKIRKKILSQGKNESYDIITEEGELLKDPEENKEYIANFYENLYKAREGTPEYEDWTNLIKAKVQEMDQAELDDEPDFTTNELKKAVKSLKRGKANGPDNLPNELFIESNNATENIHRSMMNNILQTTEIPLQWKEGDLKRLFKGKGIKGKCSNERGITLASNVGKMFERLVNNRVVPTIQMTDAQAGGTKGRATVDHILILKELASIAKQQKQQLILTYMDVTKAYDKAWLDAIMYVLQTRGLKTKLWKLVKELNSNLMTTVQTKYGPTRKISITDSIRQGGVLSVSMYALMMDETNKALMETDLGVKIPHTDTKVPCLLWMDDVVLAETKPERAQKELDITNHTSLKYHVEYGMPKTKYLRMGQPKKPITLLLGKQILEETDKYTYLGEINNNKMNMSDQIKAIERKVEAAYQTLIAVAEDREFKKIKMQSIWTLVNTCIVPIIAYASETWHITKQEKKKLNQIMDKILRRILMTPNATPREALYIETGLLDIETTADSKRLNMKARLNREKSDLMAKILDNPQCMWEKDTGATMTKYDVKPEELIGSKYQTKSLIKRAILKHYRVKIEQAGQGKSKTEYFTEAKSDWQPGKRAQYMNELTRKQTSLIFKARTRMLKVKGNYKNGYTDLTCRMCKSEEESQTHILETCSVIHPDDAIKVPKRKLFTEDTGTLREVASTIGKIQDKLNEVVC